MLTELLKEISLVEEKPFYKELAESVTLRRRQYCTYVFECVLWLKLQVPTQGVGENSLT